jgi:alkylhydroperoxidase family enzyme
VLFQNHDSMASRRVHQPADGGVPDDVHAQAAAHFDEQELAHILALILTINTWNRVALSTAKAAGTDQRR